MSYICLTKQQSIINQCLQRHTKFNEMQTNYYTVLKDGAIKYFNNIENALIEIPKTYKKIELSKFEKMMRNPSNRKALSFTLQDIKLTKSMSINEGEEVEILEEYIAVSKKTYNNLIK